MKFIHIDHLTQYHYQTDVLLAHHLAHLRPLKTSWQKPQHSELLIVPTPVTLHENCDAFGNTRSFFSLSHPHHALQVRAQSCVQKLPRYLNYDPCLSPSWESVHASMTYALDQIYVPASEFVWPSPYVPFLPELRDYALQSFKRRMPLAQACLDLNHRIHQDFRYVTGATETHTPLAETFHARHGIGQDFAHIMIGCLRAIGLAARYVSGYRWTDAPHDAPHAWVSVYCPDAPGQWLELDPSNDTIADMAYISLAVGRDFGDVSPLRGIIRGGGNHELRIAVTTTESHETIGKE